MKLSEKNFIANKQQIKDFCTRCRDDLKTNFIRCYYKFLTRAEFWIDNPSIGYNDKFIIDFNLVEKNETGAKDCNFTLELVMPTKKTLELFKNVGIINLIPKGKKNYIATFFISEQLTPSNKVGCKMIEYVTNLLNLLDEKLTQEYENFKNQNTIK